MEEFLWLACEKQLVLLPDTSEEHSQNHFIKLICLYFFQHIIQWINAEDVHSIRPLPTTPFCLGRGGGGQLSVNDVPCEKRFCKTKSGFEGSISNIDLGLPGGTYDVPCQKSFFEIKYGLEGSISNVDSGFFQPNNQIMFSFVTF